MKFIMIAEGINQDNALSVLTKAGKEDLFDTISEIDTSKNSKNLPCIAYFAAQGTDDPETLSDVFSKAVKLEDKKAISGMQYTKRGVRIGEKVFRDFIDFSEFIDGEYNLRIDTASDSKVNKKESKSVSFKPIFTNDKVDIYLADTPQKSIALGKNFSFCIAQPANTMWLTYRMRKQSTFYYIFDKTRDDVLSTVVYDNTDTGIELTDISNTTTTIQDPFTGNRESGDKVVKSYNKYLKSLGVDINKLKNIPITEAEQSEIDQVSKMLSDEEFKKLSLPLKEKYIAYGHNLTTTQLDFITPNKKLLYNYLISGNAIPKDYYDKMSGNYKKSYLRSRNILFENNRNINFWEVMEIGKLQSNREEFYEKYITSHTVDEDDIAITDDLFKDIYAEFLINIIKQDKQLEIWQYSFVKEFTGEDYFDRLDFKEISGYNVYLLPEAIQKKYAEKYKDEVYIEKENGFTQSIDNRKLIPVIKIIGLDIEYLWDMIRGGYYTISNEKGNYNKFLSEDEKKTFITLLSENGFKGSSNYDMWEIDECLKYNIPIKCDSHNAGKYYNHLKKKGLEDKIAGYVENRPSIKPLESAYNVFKKLGKEQIFIDGSSDRILYAMGLKDMSSEIKESLIEIFENEDWENDILHDNLKTSAQMFAFVLDENITFTEEIYNLINSDEFFEGFEYNNSSYLDGENLEYYTIAEMYGSSDNLYIDKNPYFLENVDEQNYNWDYFRKTLSAETNKELQSLSEFINDDIKSKLIEAMASQYSDSIDELNNSVAYILDSEHTLDLENLTDYTKYLKFDDNNLVEILSDNSVAIKPYEKYLNDNYSIKSLSEFFFYDIIDSKELCNKHFIDDSYYQSIITDILEDIDILDVIKLFDEPLSDAGFDEEDYNYTLSGGGVTLTFNIKDISYDGSLEDIDDIEDINYRILITKTYSKGGKDITKKIQLSDIKKAKNHLNPELFEKRILSFEDFKKLF